MSKSAEAHVSAATEKMGVVEKLGFMTFSMSDNIVYQFKAIYYMFFLTNVLGISVGTAGAVFAIGTVWDAVNDPLLGYMALNTRFKSGEKIRPFILYAVPWAFSIVALFWAFPGSELFKAVVAEAIYFIFEAFNTFCGIPYNSMGSVATNRDDDRRSLNVYRNIGGCLGTAIGALACLPLLKLFGAMDSTGNLTAAANRGFILTATVMGVICVAGAAVHFFTTRERVHQVEDNDEKIPFGEVVRMLVSCPSFIRNTLYVACYGCGNTLLLTCITYYATYALGSTAAATSIQAAYLVVSLIMSVLVGPIDRALGRRRTMILGAVMLILSKVWFILQPSNVIALYVNAAVTGVGVAIAFVMFNTNRNNIVDLVEAKEGRRLDSMVSTVDNLMAKLSQSGVTWFIGFWLASAGFNADLTAQPAAVVPALNFLLGWAPLIFAVIMLVVVWRFRIEEEVADLAAKREGL
ncbi:MAG: MFS transporter [Coriobacteriaceae bacterium]|nr:MFS transporter [Coriobacteriaceae bacterium]